jgi:hypothetical protein
MWGGWGGLAEGLSGSLQDRRKEQSKDPAPGNKGPDSGMTRGAQRRAYRIILVAAALVAALILRACSVTIESGAEGRYAHPESHYYPTPTPGAKR